MARPGKVLLKKVTLAMPEELYTEVEHIVRVGRRWISEADFIRNAVANEVERWKAAGHRLPEGPSPGDLVEAVREREPGRGRRPSP